ncbi:TadE/TadG family type IV pilus assembly protein [Streptomyces sp. NPDC051569]|uniref:TadE/TadG family type IV pilus assembly protein n=1 Tax=Streptomyces sp. NPDC051569 TaxID=3365661 RepID=UPI0037BC7642
MAGRPLGAGRLGTGLRDDRGQAIIEFTGVVPFILLTAFMLWQAALVGYTFSLAGNAADEGVRAATVAPLDRNGACERAAKKHLPAAWTARGITCRADGDLVKAEVDVKVPMVIPGVFNVPFDITIPGRAAAVRES